MSLNCAEPPEEVKLLREIRDSRFAEEVAAHIPGLALVVRWTQIFSPTMQGNRSGSRDSPSIHMAMITVPAVPMQVYTA